MSSVSTGCDYIHTMFACLRGQKLDGVGCTYDLHICLVFHFIINLIYKPVSYPVIVSLQDANFRIILPDQPICKNLYFNMGIVDFNL